MQLMLCVSAAFAVTVMFSMSDSLALCRYLFPSQPQGMIFPRKVHQQSIEAVCNMVVVICRAPGSPTKNTPLIDEDHLSSDAPQPV